MTGSKRQSKDTNYGNMKGRMLLPVKKAKHLQHHTSASPPMDYRPSLMVALIIEELPGRQK